MSLHSIALAASTEVQEEPAIDPYLVGGITLAILLLALVALLMFGAGREHS